MRGFCPPAIAATSGSFESAAGLAAKVDDPNPGRLTRVSPPYVERFWREGNPVIVEPSSFVGADLNLYLSGVDFDDWNWALPIGLSKGFFPKVDVLADHEFGVAGRLFLGPPDVLLGEVFRLEVSLS